MQKIKIETTQNVTIEYELASVGDRIVASLIDGAFITGYIIVVLLINAIISFENSGYNITFWIIAIVPVVFYDLLCETFLGGQSFGKKIRKIKVIKMDGRQPGFVTYFLRWILRPIDISFTYGSVAIITILINGKGQRLGDMAANSTVIKFNEDPSINDTIFSEVTNHTLQFPQVSLLTDKDMGLIKEVIEQVEGISNMNLYDRILARTFDAVTAKMGIRPQMNALTFLQIVIKDYNSLNIK